MNFCNRLDVSATCLDIGDVIFGDHKWVEFREEFEEKHKGVKDFLSTPFALFAWVGCLNTGYVTV